MEIQMGRTVGELFVDVIIEHAYNRCQYQISF